jgi:ABC-2 type transport system permease protein
MKWYRIAACFQRYYYFFAKMDHVTDQFFWPAMDILLWGMTSVWIQTSDVHFPLALAILSGLVFWQLIWRSNYEVSVNLLQEFWSRNLVNLFSSPLKIREWIFSLMLVGAAKTLVSLAFGTALVWIIYTLNIFSIGWAFLPYYVSLIISGWFLGFLSAGIIVYFGQRFQMLAWMTAYFFMPFSAVLYPLEVLPEWAQIISRCLPMTYIFEGMRQVLFQHSFSWNMFWISIGLNFLYLAICLIFFLYMFEKSRDKGLSRLE